VDSSFFILFKDDIVNIVSSPWRTSTVGKIKAWNDYQLLHLALSVTLSSLGMSWALTFGVAQR
jgi:hypothetical protein